MIPPMGTAATFWLVRHAPVAEKGLCYGALELEPPMAAEQAADVVLGDSPRVPCTRIVTSPRLRCAALANALSARLELPQPTVLAALAELSFGAWEGRAWSELETVPGFNHWMEHWQSARPPGGESLPELQERVRQCLESGALEGAIVVTHAGPIRILRSLTRGLSLDAVWSMSVPHLMLESFPL
jgi:alpha-ribazole phosphatase